MKLEHRITPQTPLAELIDLIEEKHHGFTRAELQRIAGLLDDPELAELPQLGEIRQCFGALRADLDSHLAKEERILFPHISALDGNPSRPPASCFGSVANPIRVMRMEHIAMVGLLECLRELTSEYRPEPSSGPSAFLLYAALAGLDSDLMEHMHWEDNVLFPRALQLESRLAAE